jgi:peroxiredoxin Q/BCP
MSQAVDWLMLGIGDKAPDFTLKDQRGEAVSLHDLAGKIVVLYFYPKDMSYGCTKEACAFRDSYEQFKDAGAEVVGVSSQSVESHTIFSTTYALPFTLLSDADGTVRRLYGVQATFRLIPGRVTFVIDRQGVIRHAFDSQFNPEMHVQEALRIIRALS